MIAQEIIKRQEEFRGLRPDLKTIAKIPATTWQPWFEEDQVVFSLPALIAPVECVISLKAIISLEAC